MSEPEDPIGELARLHLREIVDENPFQLRVRTTLADLIRSIEEAKRVLVPIIVRPAPGRKGMFQIVDGHRRVAAMRETTVGEDTLLALIVHHLADDQEAMWYAAVVNTARKTYDLVDQAWAVWRLFQSGCDRERIHGALGHNPQTQEDLERLLRLETCVQDAAADPTHPFDLEHAKVLMPFVAGRKKGHRKTLDQKRWVEEVGREAIDASELKRRVLAEIMPRALRAPFSILQRKGTDEEASVFRFAPVRVDVRSMTRAQLRLVDKQLGQVRRAVKKRLEELKSERNGGGDTSEGPPS